MQQPQPTDSPQRFVHNPYSLVSSKSPETGHQPQHGAISMDDGGFTLPPSANPAQLPDGNGAPSGTPGGSVLPPHMAPRGVQHMLSESPSIPPHTISPSLLSSYVRVGAHRGSPAQHPGYSPQASLTGMPTHPGAAQYGHSHGGSHPTTPAMGAAQYGHGGGGYGGMHHPHQGTNSPGLPPHSAYGPPQGMRQSPGLPAQGGFQPFFPQQPQQQHHDGGHQYAQPQYQQQQHPHHHQQSPGHHHQPPPQQVFHPSMSVHQRSTPPTPSRQPQQHGMTGPVVGGYPAPERGPVGMVPMPVAHHAAGGGRGGHTQGHHHGANPPPRAAPGVLSHAALEQRGLRYLRIPDNAEQTDPMPRVHRSSPGSNPSDPSSYNAGAAAAPSGAELFIVSPGPDGQDMLVPCRSKDIFLAQLPFQMKLQTIQFISNYLLRPPVPILHVAHHLRNGKTYDGCAFIKVRDLDAERFVTVLHKSILFDDGGIWVAENEVAKEELANYCREMQQMGPEQRRLVLQRTVPFSAMTAEIAKRDYVL